VFPLTQRIVTDPSCLIVSFATFCTAQAYRIAKIRSLGHMTEDANFNDARKHLDLAHNLQESQLLNYSYGGPYSIRIRQFVLLKGCVDDKVAIIADHRPR